VLLLCLKLKQIALGAAFSIGLALTMVVSGMLAAISVKYESKRWSGFCDFARKTSYFLGALIMLVGLFVG
jgi:nickel/cobalt transporter (NicO) family protein